MKNKLSDKATDLFVGFAIVFGVFTCVFAFLGMFLKLIFG
jgi:hypothetical protein